MRFIHAADIHLDSPLTGLSAYADAPVQMLRTATRDAFSNLVSAAVEQEVDFMLIAGDLYDGAWKDHNTGIFFSREMGRLRRAGIPVYVLFGNHDAESEMTRKLVLPDNVFAFESRRPTTFRIDRLNVALHGHSFKEAATTHNLVTGYPEPAPGMFNIGVLHTALEGNAAHASYAPCTLEELHAKGYHYWALGHVHEHKIWNGRATIVYPGNLQGRHIKECGPRGAVLVHADESGVQEVERLFVDVLRWEHLEVQVDDCVSLNDVVRQVGQGLEGLLQKANQGLPLAVRISLGGKTGAHGDLFGMEAQLRAEVLALAATIGPERLWIEKVRVATLPLDDGAAVRERTDALADLHQLLQTAETDAQFLEDLREDLLGLATKAPLELQALVPMLRQIREGDLSELVQEVRPGLMAYLERME